MYFKRLFFILLVSFVLLSGCVARLDSFFFNPKKLTEYKWGDYQGEVELEEVNEMYPDSGIDNFPDIERRFKSGDFTLYAAHLIHSAITNRKTIFYCHGNAHHLDYYWPRVKLLYQTGWNVFAFDYKEYGKSEGTISEEALYEDVESAINYLTGLGVSKTNILLYGYSMGSAPATHAAANHAMSSAIGIVLEAPFASSDLFVQDATGLPFVSTFFTDLNLNVGELITSVKLPLLWLHGNRDSRVRYDTHGISVYNNHPSPKYKQVLNGGLHYNLPEVWGYASYITAVSNMTLGVNPF